MTEEEVFAKPEFQLVNIKDDDGEYRLKSKLQNADTFIKIANLVDRDQKTLQEVNDQYLDYVQRLIMVSLKEAFGEKDDEFTAFILELVELTSSSEQMEKIDRILVPEDWQKIKQKLNDEFFSKIIKGLKK
ncbi:MAG: hypothetical protein ABIJ22_02670 [Patescibacteria group bacterium]